MGLYPEMWRSKTEVRNRLTAATTGPLTPVTHIDVIDVLCDTMVSVTLSVPEEMREEMDEHPEINWSQVARQSIDRKLKELQFLEEFKKHSELTEEDAVELGRKLKEDVAEHYEE